ncbi:hypothetical protein R6Z07F_016829 [Ovis aries]|nr:protein PBMUCL2-like isoform X1 [Ovis aries]XP_042093388.1 protein PBMUCL2-like isoform X1 [Ovis aries]
MEDHATPDLGIMEDYTTQDPGTTEDYTTPDLEITEDHTTPDPGTMEDHTTPDLGIMEDYTTPDMGITEDHTTPDLGITEDYTTPDPEPMEDYTTPGLGTMEDYTTPDLGITENYITPDPGTTEKYTTADPRITEHYTTPDPGTTEDYTTEHPDTQLEGTDSVTAARPPVLLPPSRIILISLAATAVTVALFVGFGFLVTPSPECDHLCQVLLGRRPQRDTWPPGLWIVLKAEKDKVKMQKHPEGQIGRLKESGKSLPDHSWDPGLQGLVMASTSYYAHTRCDTIIYYT